MNRFLPILFVLALPALATELNLGELRLGGGTVASGGVADLTDATNHVTLATNNLWTATAAGLASATNHVTLATNGAWSSASDYTDAAVITLSLAVGDATNNSYISAKAYTDSVHSGLTNSADYIAWGSGAVGNNIILSNYNSSDLAGRLYLKQQDGTGSAAMDVDGYIYANAADINGALEAASMSVGTAGTLSMAGQLMTLSSADFIVYDTILITNDAFSGGSIALSNKNNGLLIANTASGIDGGLVFVTDSSENSHVRNAESDAIFIIASGLQAASQGSNFQCRYDSNWFNGTVRATKFYGDGSELTGVTGGGITDGNNANDIPYWDGDSWEPTNNLTIATLNVTNFNVDNDATFEADITLTNNARYTTISSNKIFMGETAANSIVFTNKIDSDASADVVLQQADGTGDANLHISGGFRAAEEAFQVSNIGMVTVPDGSVSVPSVHGATDAVSGLSFPATGNMSVVINSSQLGYFNSSGWFAAWGAGMGWSDNRIERVDTDTVEIVASDGSTPHELRVSSVVLASPSVPASASATGTTGTVAWDSDYVYICVATDTWKRAALSTW